MRQFIVSVYDVKIPVAVALVTFISQVLQLGSGNTAPDIMKVSRSKRILKGVSKPGLMARKQNLPVLPRPASMFLNLDPRAKSDFALGDFDLLLFANGVFASRPVVGRNFCMLVSAMMELSADETGDRVVLAKGIVLTDSILRHSAKSSADAVAGD